jgi:Fe2+ or Zn2+ uptake regulation protein/Fe2+ transport system protein FeoA
MTFQERAAAAIRASGGRITSQRELLLDLLAGADDYLDAETLHTRASTYDAGISLPTVYRTLNTLEAAGLIAPRFVSSEHERKVYRVAGDRDMFHFTCRRCGRVIAFHTPLIEQLKQEMTARMDADVFALCLCAGGLCADCRQEQTNMTLDQLDTKQTATVRRIRGEGAVRRRLMDMGLVRGVAIERIKAAPMGDPVEYLVRGYHLSLRKTEAALVEIELC